MRGKGPTNISASVKQRLLNQSNTRGQEFNYTLTQYVIERFLYRLSQSPHRERFVLKGASLFLLWARQPHRATWDLDLLGRGGGTIPEIETAIREICRTPVEDDGLHFDTESLQGEPIREADEYQGVRVRLLALLGEARITVQVDVGFGNAVTPPPKFEAYPTYLEQPQPVVLAYPREAVVAEKLEAMVALGPTNSRMKDFYDLHYLATHFEFAGSVLVTAVRGTFERRRTPLPDGIPVGLTDEFGVIPERAAQWRAFVRRSRLQGREVTLPGLTGLLREFLLPLLQAARERAAFQRAWAPSGPWQ